VTPSQALRVIEAALYNQATSSIERQEEALDTLWNFVLLGEDERSATL
jgi:hypothetical protein